MNQRYTTIARILADYERGKMPDDAIQYSACYQLSDLLQVELASLRNITSEQEQIAALAALLIETSRRDTIVAGLITAIVRDEPAPNVHTHRVPIEFTVATSTTLVYGDQYNLSGDFQGAVVNVASSLTGVIQKVQKAPFPAQSKLELANLLGELLQLVSHLPGSDLPAVASAVQMLMPSINLALERPLSAENGADSLIRTITTNLPTSGVLEIDGLAATIAQKIAQIVVEEPQPSRAKPSPG
jgi:hypothetical protein